MKVLFVTDQMGIGGAETHIIQLGKELVRLGVEVTLASGCPKEGFLPHFRDFRFVSLPLPSHDPRKLLLARRRLWRLCKRERFDIVHAHARIPALLIRGLWRYGAAEIVTVHARFSVNRLLSRLCYWGQYTVAVSQDLSCYLAKHYGIPKEQISIIPNGIDTKVFSPAQGRNENDARRVRILFASRLDRDCSLGARLLCALAPSLSALDWQVEIAIAGGGEELSSVAELAKRANQKLGRHAVTVLGTVLDMPALLKAQDIFVGVSRAAMEAASCGSAVILCGNEGYGGILSADTADAAMQSNFCARGEPHPTEALLLRDLVHLITHPDDRERVADEGRTWMLLHCNAEAAARETLALYGRAVGLTRKKRILIGGYFGCGNLGDDAILEGLLGEWKRQAPFLSPTVLSGNPMQTRRRFGVASIYRFAPLSFLFCLLRADALLLGGGSLLQDLTSRRSLFYYLFLLKIAQLLRKPTVLCAAGIGPLMHSRSQKAVRKVLQECRSIGLRDEGSRRFLTELGIDPARLHTSADPALLLSARVCERKDELCIILKGGTGGSLTRRLLLAGVRNICRSFSLKPHFVIFDAKHDLRVTLGAWRELGGRLSRPSSPDEALTLLASCRAVLSMRLHGMILSALVGTPCVGVSPSELDKKTEAFALAAGQCCLSRTALDVPSLTDALQNALQKHLPDPILAASVEELQKKAQKDLANIAQMIYNIDSKA